MGFSAKVPSCRFLKHLVRFRNWGSKVPLNFYKPISKTPSMTVVQALAYRYRYPVACWTSRPCSGLALPLALEGAGHGAGPRTRPWTLDPGPRDRAVLPSALVLDACLTCLDWIPAATIAPVPRSRQQPVTSTLYPVPCTLSQAMDVSFTAVPQLPQNLPPGTRGEPQLMQWVMGTA